MVLAEKCEGLFPLGEVHLDLALGFISLWIQVPPPADSKAAACCFHLMSPCPEHTADRFSTTTQVLLWVQTSRLHCLKQGI